MAPRAKKAKGLTPLQERFVGEYLIDLNATQAAIRAGYSARAANALAPRILRYPAVARAISLGKAKVLRKLEVTQTDVVQRLAQVAYANITDLVHEENGRIRYRRLHEVRPEVIPAISGIEPIYDGEGNITDYKLLFDGRLTALRELAKHTGAVEGGGIEVTVAEMIEEMGGSAAYAEAVDRLTHPQKQVSKSLSGNLPLGGLPAQKRISHG